MAGFGGFNPLDYPSCLVAPRRVTAVAWHEHIPFAMALVEMLRPQTIVELGVHSGDSYLAFCQAVDELRITVKVFGIDTWQGDPHSGTYGEEVLRELRNYHDPLYGRFSTLTQSSFENAVVQFADGSVDLLHVDGYHTYDAVSSDWMAWRPKLSASGVVLFHDTNVRERDFGVWRLWNELSSQYPHFEFRHGHGLGVLAVGPNGKQLLRPLLELNDDCRRRVCHFFYMLGTRLTLASQHRSQVEAIDALSAKLKEYDDVLRIRNSEKDALTAKVKEYDDALRIRNSEQAELEARIVEYDRVLRLRNSETAVLTAKVKEYDEALRIRNAEKETLEAKSLEYENVLNAEKRALETKIQEYDGALRANGLELERLSDFTFRSRLRTALRVAFKASLDRPRGL